MVQRQEARISKQSISESADDGLAKKSPKKKFDEIDVDLYSMPKMSSNDNINLIDDDEPAYIKIPEKNFDASIIYDIKKSEYDKNNNNERIVNNNSNIN